MKHRFARLVVSGVCVALTLGLSSQAVAAPSSLDQKRADAERLQQGIDANGEKISMLAERYDEARLRLDTANKNIATVKASLAAAGAETNHIRGLVRVRAAAMYMSAASDSPFGFVDVASVHEAGVRAKYASTTAGRDAVLLGRLRAAQQDYDAAEQSLEKAQKQAQDEVSAIEGRRREVEAANATQAKLLSQVKGEIVALVAEVRARAAAAEKARSDAALAALRRRASTAPPAVSAAPVGPSRGDPSGVAIPSARAPSSGAAAAVAYAQAQLGKPYRYAGVGPDAYDCSGLTMMAWAQGGVSMPHGSIAQGNMFPRVPDNAMQPGDLVIYYPDHHHVGMYVGGGMTISATHTGDFVRLQPVFRSGFQFAVRPG